MKKVFACFLTIALIAVCFAACSKYTGKITWEEESNHYIITLEEFSGTYKVRLSRTVLGEGCISYRANLTQGSVAVSYHMGSTTLVHSPEPLFTAEADKPLDDQGGYVEGDTVSIIFEADAPVSGEITLSFAKHSHTGKWVQNESTHYYQYTCGCPSPDIAELHMDADNDFFCDVCEYKMSESPAPTNHFLRNQAGAEWLQEITADDIAEIKMIRSASGVAPGSLKNISSSTNRSPIERLFEQYYWLDTTPVAAEDVRVPGGSTLTVQFILKGGTVKELTFDNEAYFDGKGNAFKPLYIPTFNDVPEFTSYYSFVSYEGTALVNAYTDGAAEVVHTVCTIPMDDLIFIPFEGSIGAAPTDYPYYVHTEFGDLVFHYNDLFNVAGTGQYYQLIGKNLEELICEYSYRMHDPQAEYVSIRKYYGRFASGALVAMIDSGDYPCVVWEETVGNTVITYGDGNRILVLLSGEFYTLPAAYAAGYLTDADVAEIAKTHMEG